MLRMKTGDAEALQLLYLEFGPLVHGVVRRVLSDPEDAREIVQDTFIRAWRNAAAYQPDRGEAIAWVVFIARHAAIDRSRRSARQRSLQAALRREIDDAPATPAIGDDAREDAARRLDALSTGQRQALELAFFGGCTQAQIAAAMQTPIGNVKNHLRRGLQKLRQLASGHE
jgi:RNA polymerase sigma-70 factor (ECF subfamily)